MCGITGIFNFDGEPVSPILLRKMTDAIAHRGPDGEGFYLDGAVGLGHRRLAIIDLSPAGHQPMITADGRYAITYNGEIYNFQQIRLELESMGHHFHSRTDTEVLLHAYARWGEGILNRLNGMFAFAIWDKEKQELFIARDRYGVKPIYYALVGQSLLFASEAKAILTHPQFKREMDKEALLEYLTFQNFFTSKTLLKGIHVFPPASFTKLRPGAAVLPRPQEYWDFQFEEPLQAQDETAYLEELGRLFKQAVNRQLVSDVPVGAYLSGGMDSGSITAVAAGQLENMRTFTVGFDLHSASGMEIVFDERERAEYMSYLFGTEHYEMVLKAGDMERALPRMAWHLEEPRVGQSYPNFYAAQLASKFGKVVLSGAGGDELFGGYPWRYYRAVVNDNFDHYIDKYYHFWQRLLDQQLAEAVFQPIWDEVGHVSTRDIFKQVFHKHSPELTRPVDYINHSLYFEAKTFLHGLLVIEDKLSMAHGLETRVPFLDNDLVDFAMTVPVQYKLGNLTQVVELNENEPGPKTAKYFEKTRDGKLLLRQAMQRYIPEEVTRLAKQGFSAPDASWFKGESIDYVKRTLFDDKAPIYEFLDRSTIHRLVNEHLEGRQNRRLLIWSLLNLTLWCKTFLE